MPRTLLVAVLIALSFVPTSARAQESEETRKRRALALMEEAQANYDIGNFDESITLLEKAWNIWTYPEILFNLCQAYRQKKDFDRATFHCKGYLRNKPTSTKRAEVEGLLSEMEKAIAAQKAAQEKPPEGMEPAPPIGDKPTPIPIAPPEPRDEPDVPQWYRDWAGWTLAGSGVALLVTGSLLQVSALGLHDDAATALDPTIARELQDRAETRQTVALVVSGVGVAALVVGVIKLVIHEPAKREAPAVQAGVDLRADGFGAVVTVSF